MRPLQCNVQLSFQCQCYGILKNNPTLPCVTATHPSQERRSKTLSCPVKNKKESTSPCHIRPLPTTPIRSPPNQTKAHLKKVSLVPLGTRKRIPILNRTAPYLIQPNPSQPQRNKPYRNIKATPLRFP